MSLYVDIKKQLEAYRLELQFESASKRLGILGESGAGKSMTLKCIAGIETPDSGQIILDTTTVYDKNKRIDRRPQERSIGYLFQNYALFPTMSVEKNIGAGLKNFTLKVWKNVFRVSCPAVRSRGRHLQGSWPMSRTCYFWMNRSLPLTESLRKN